MRLLFQIKRSLRSSIQGNYMKIGILIAIITSLLMGGISFIASNNIFLALIVGVIFLLYYFIFASRKLKVFFSKVYRIHHCYKFINSFIITMSVTNSINESYNNAIQGMEGELKDVLKELDALNGNEKLNYLRKYFNLAIYKMFLNVTNLYLEQGGNILDMSESLIAETTRIEDSLNKSISSIKKNLIEFVVLWTISLGVLLFMRFGVSSFYLMMIKSPIFIILLGVYFLFILVSIHLALMRMTSMFIKEDKA